MISYDRARAGEPALPQEQPGRDAADGGDRCHERQRAGYGVQATSKHDRMPSVAERGYGTRNEPASEEGRPQRGRPWSRDAAGSEPPGASRYTKPRTPASRPTRAVGNSHDPELRSQPNLPAKSGV